MKAFQFTRYKGPLQAVDLPVPALSATNVLVKVAAASLNQLDEMLRVGTFKAMLPYPLPLTLGSDFAGEIVAVGDRVKNFSVGDFVYSKPRKEQIGSFAEFIAVDESDVALKPKSVSVVEAASIPLVALTAWQALVERGNISRGDKVLIHGGAGGVGSIAIQLAKHLGAQVATTVSAKNMEYVEALGADVVVDYATQDFSTKLDGYDFVLDTQGGSTLMKSLSVLRKDGLVVGIAGPPDKPFATSFGLNGVVQTIVSVLSARVNRAARKLGVRYEFLFVQSSGKQLEALAALVDAGTIRTTIGRTFSFDETPFALTELAAGRLGRGKAVIIVDV